MNKFPYESYRDNFIFDRFLSDLMNESDEALEKYMEPKEIEELVVYAIELENALKQARADMALLSAMSRVIEIGNINNQVNKN